MAHFWPFLELKVSSKFKTRCKTEMNTVRSCHLAMANSLKTNHKNKSKEVMAYLEYTDVYMYSLEGEDDTHSIYIKC